MLLFVFYTVLLSLLMNVYSLNSVSLTIFSTKIPLEITTESLLELCLLLFNVLE